MAQMKHKDARVLEFYRHVRSAIDVLELIALDPYQPPEKVVPEVPVAPPAPPPEIPSEKLTYTIKEAAAALGVGRTTLWRAVSDGKLTAIKFGSRTLIPADGLRQWIAAMPRARR
jgi:excisionase family DNA binding protein